MDKEQEVMSDSASGHAEPRLPAANQSPQVPTADPAYPMRGKPSCAICRGSGLLVLDVLQVPLAQSKWPEAELGAGANDCPCINPPGDCCTCGERLYVAANGNIGCMHCNPDPARK